MKNAPDKLQWHPAFCAAAGLEFHEDIERLELKPEYNLSKGPIRIDLLIIKEESDRRIKNEIGHIMRTYNVIEYKSPEDALTIDDFYKTVGYACLYKGYGERVDAVPINELTVSIFRATRPEKMFLTLQKYGHKIEEKYPGIYYVTEHLPFPAQIIVTQELEPGEHRSLRILSNHAKKEDIEEFLRNVEEMNTPRDRQNVEAVLQVSVKANDELYREIRRDANMCDALRELMKDDLEDARKLGESEGEAKIIINMNRSGMSPENIASITGKGSKKVMRYEKKQYIITFLIGKCCIILRSKNRLHHLCAAAIAIFSYLLSGDECKAVIKTLESKSPAITPSNGQYQTTGMFCQMSRKLHKITDYRTYSSAMYFLPREHLSFQRFLPYAIRRILYAIIVSSSTSLLLSNFPDGSLSTSMSVLISL